MGKRHRASLIQWALSPDEYLDQRSFSRAVSRRCSAAAGFADTSLLVFPELSGLWIGFSRLLKKFPDSKPLALLNLALRSPKSAAWLLAGRGAAVLCPDDHRERWLRPFIESAVKHRVYICPGSSFLPGRGRSIYNTSCLISPEGEVMGYRRKIHLTRIEKYLGTASGSLEEDLEPFDTPWGKTAIAICLDGFKQQVIDELDRKGTELLLQPSANSRDWYSFVPEGNKKVPQHVQWIETGVGKLIQGKRHIRIALNPMDATRHPLVSSSGCSAAWRNSRTAEERQLAIAPDPYTETVLNVCISTE